MGRGVCMCTMGPPPGGVCNACGAVGPPLPNQQALPVAPVPAYAQLTAEDVRRIVREEMERFREDLEKLAKS